ncbi:MAG: Cupin 2 conserved barrel domain protein [Planctomycetaceae bacterium]|nr:Cupin 2 conserved barrel domain protein [Planctomycetaceae bacterium]
MAARTEIPFSIQQTLLARNVPEYRIGIVACCDRPMYMVIRPATRRGAIIATLEFRPYGDVRPFCFVRGAMKRKTLHFGEGFRLAIGNDKSQAAEMVLASGDTEGGPDNRHRGSDQWMLVAEGEGLAIVNGHSYELTAGVVMLIEAGDTHEIRATGDTPLKTLNIYVPPAYLDDNTPLPAGMP